MIEASNELKISLAQHPQIATDGAVQPAALSDVAPSIIEAASAASEVASSSHNPQQQRKRDHTDSAVQPIDLCDVEPVPMSEDNEPTAAAMDASCIVEQITYDAAQPATHTTSAERCNAHLRATGRLGEDHIIYKFHVAESEYSAKVQRLRTRPPPAAPADIAGDMRLLFKEYRRYLDQERIDAEAEIWLDTGTSRKETSGVAHSDHQATADSATLPVQLQTTHGPCEGINLYENLRTYS